MNELSTIVRRCPPVHTVSFEETAGHAGLDPDATRATFERQTSNRLDILTRFAMGHKSRAVAAATGRSPRTIKNTVSNMRDAIGIARRVDQESRETVQHPTAVMAMLALTGGYIELYSQERVGVEAKIHSRASEILHQRSLGFSSAAAGSRLEKPIMLSTVHNYLNDARIATMTSSTQALIANQIQGGSLGLITD